MCDEKVSKFHLVGLFFLILKASYFVEKNIAMKTPKILKIISEDSICYFQSSINYTLLQLENGKTMISGYNIKVFEVIYENNNFVKVNRSNFVNVAFIQQTIFEKNACSILLTNGDEMPVSRRRLNQLKENYPMLF